MATNSLDAASLKADTAAQFRTRKPACDQMQHKSNQARRLWTKLAAPENCLAEYVQLNKKRGGLVLTFTLNILLKRSGIASIAPSHNLNIQFIK
jgi:hypothetical protein